MISGCAALLRTAARALVGETPLHVIGLDERLM
jgi:hypothetical protein